MVQVPAAGPPFDIRQGQERPETKDCMHSLQLQEGKRGGDPMVLQEAKEVSGKTHKGGVSQPKGQSQPKKGQVQRPPGRASSQALRSQCKHCGKEHRPGDWAKGHFSTQCAPRLQLSNGCSFPRTSDCRKCSKMYCTCVSSCTGSGAHVQA